MTAQSRLYSLKASENNVQLSNRQTGDLISEVYFSQSGENLEFPKAPSVPDEEAARLILQWAFELQDVQNISMPIENFDPEKLILWVNFGAKLSEKFMQVDEEDFTSANRVMGCRGASWLERPLPSVNVAAIALVNSQDQILLAKRPQGKSFAGFWEFPGGKIEGNESPELALCREVYEELGVHVWNSCLSPLTFVSHSYDDFHLIMLAFVCYKYEGAPTPKEGQVLEWWSVKDLNPKLMPPANASIVHALQDLLG